MDPDSLARTILAYRYLSAISLVSTVWDHLLNLEHEVEVIWSNRREQYFLKAAFLIGRYGTHIALGYTTYILSGAATLDDHVCKTWVWLFTIIGGASIAWGEFVVAQRIHALWGYQRRIRYILTGIYTVAFCALPFLVIFTCVQLQSKVMPLFNICVFVVKPMFSQWLIGLLSFLDVCVISLTILNALDKPHRTNMDVLLALHRDGLKFFVLLFVIRFSALLMIVLGGLGDSFVLLPVMWALSTTINSRLLLRVGKKQAPRIPISI
ncbi:hypothetical protein BDQ12DRAFT_657419 [Crucibulum laeve]|uniref:DUF6533 domain-containing protein n=1 Tax=Crucibulum laeve TaxID=68775 RepID=A0A5C3LPT3_9AGAR|nr:hypothetical protein BDQ12DRAFT_657419 [Crucibulum laeve]